MPGSYTENVTLAQGITLFGNSGVDRGITINGSVTCNIGSIGVSRPQRISALVNLYIDATGGTYAVDFTGSNPQELRITNCYLSGGATGSAGALRMNNTGVDGSGLVSIVLADSVLLQNTGTNTATPFVQSSGNLAIRGRFEVGAATGNTVAIAWSGSAIAYMASPNFFVTGLITASSTGLIALLLATISTGGGAAITQNGSGVMTLGTVGISTPAVSVTTMIQGAGALLYAPASLSAIRYNGVLLASTLNGGLGPLAVRPGFDYGTSGQYLVSQGAQFAPTWTSVSPGAQGFQGAQGSQGFQGVSGPQGNQGDSGPQGNQGDSGPQGNQGGSGPQGNQGDSGPQGNQGDSGPQGNQGDSGAQGYQGDSGPQGYQGNSGAQGNQGNQGAQGPSTLQAAYDGGNTIQMTAADGAFDVAPANGQTVGFSIDGSTSSNVSVTGANLTLSTITSGDVALTSAAAVTATAPSGMTVNTNAVNTAAILTLQNTAGDAKIFRVDANPESSVTGSIGDIADDTTTGVVYVKTSGTATNTGWSPLATLGTKVFLVVEGGQYATIQAAIDATPTGTNTVPAYSVILVGPKANTGGGASGTWGPAVLAANKSLMIAGLGGSQTAKDIRIDSLTFDSSAAGLNANLNENYVSGLYITSSSASSIVTFSGTGAIRLRLNNCYVVNSGAGDAVTNSNTNISGSLYLDTCIVSAGSVTGIAVKHTGTYTAVRNRSDISTNAGGTGANTGRSLTASAGVVEVYDSTVGGVSVPRPIVELTGTAYLAAGYTTINNTSNDAAARCVFVNSNTATFAAGDASLPLGSSVAVAGQVVSGTGTFAYGNITFSYSPLLTVSTQTPALRTGGWFTTAIQEGISLTSPGSPLFNLNSSGRITRYNDAAPTNGQVLIGDTAAGYFKAATLTQGAGITITNGAGTITIAASGTQGAQGFQGAQGNQGNAGAQGNQGNSGPQGNQGDSGPQGNQGNAGPQGDSGPQGNQGSSGPQGNQGDSGPQGNQGDSGPQGNQGNAGPQGNQGDSGPQGNQGDSGPQGNQGDTGAQGNQGNAGPQGNQGSLGAQGNQGDAGPQGNQGDSGAQGNQGDAGAQGNQGDAGAGNSPTAVTQAANGFAVHDLIRFDTSTNLWAKSQANSSTNAEVDAIVVSVTPPDDFEYQIPWVQLSGFQGFQSGVTYFLDPTTAGDYTATPPNTAGQVSKPVLRSLSASDAIFIGMRGSVISASPATTSPKMGNTLVVDAVNGNDGSGAVNGAPFLTVEAAIAYINTNVLTGVTVWILPGTYTLASATTGLTIPANCALRGLNTQTTRIVMNASNPGSTVTLLTMGENTRVEDLSLTLNSSDTTTDLIGISLPGTTSVTSKLRTSVLTVDNSGLAVGTTTNVYGVSSDGTGTLSAATFSFNCLKGSTINVKSNGGGNKFGIYQPSTGGGNQLSTRDLNIYVAAPTTATSTGLYVGVYTDNANSQVQMRSTSVGGPPYPSTNIKLPSNLVATSNQTLSGTPTIDSVATVAGDRVLLTGQTDLVENGIWIVAAGAWARAGDMAAGSAAGDAYTFVNRGTTYTHTGWLCTTVGSVGTAALTITQVYAGCDILQSSPQASNGTNGIQIGPGTDLVTKTAGTHAFTTFVTPTTHQYCVKNGVTNGTHYLWPGTSTVDNTQVFYRFQQKAILQGMFVNLRVAPGTGGSTKVTILKSTTGVAGSGVATLMTATISGTDKSATCYTASVDFAQNEYLAVQVVDTASSAADLVVEIDLF